MNFNSIPETPIGFCYICREYKQIDFKCDRCDKRYCEICFLVNVEYDTSPNEDICNYEECEKESEYIIEKKKNPRINQTAFIKEKILEEYKQNKKDKNYIIITDRDA